MMINHNAQMTLINMRVHEFRDSKNQGAWQKVNRFIDMHNTRKAREHAIEPLDVKYGPKTKDGRLRLLLSYVPHSMEWLKRQESALTK